MNTKNLYLVSFIILGVIAIVVFLILFRKHKINKLKKHVEELERQRNLIVSTPIMTELNKVEVLLKNKELENKYEDWNKRYEYIKNDKFKYITDLSVEIDDFIADKDYKTAKEKIVNLEMEIYKLRVTTDNLLDEIREITMSEERNRSIMTKLKARFRDLERTLNSNPASYGDVYKHIELQLENIEKKFQDFEEIMENNEYEEVVKLVKVLDEMIAHISVVVEEMPDLILLTTKILPSRIKEVLDNYNKLKSKNYPLDYLRVDYNVEQIEKKLSEISDKIKILNLEDCMFELKTFLDYLDNLLNDFDFEKRSKKQFDIEAGQFKNKIVKVNKIVTDIYNQLDDIKSMYDLTLDDLNDLDSVNKEVYDANKEYNDIIASLKNKTEPYSILKEKIKDLSGKFEQIESRLNDCLKSLGSMHDDELRAREQLEEISKLLIDCRTKIRKNPLPIISNEYFVQLSEANDAIYEIIKELNKVPITIKTLNIRVDTARDLSLKLFKTTNEMIKTAKLAEMTIVYGNRYKVLDEELEKGLDVATQLFFKGNYTKSLETAIASINIVESNIYQKMLNLYKDDKKE